jgi:hypothetical protein
MYRLFPVARQMLEDCPPRRIRQGLEDSFRCCLHYATITIQLWFVKRLILCKRQSPESPPYTLAGTIVSAPHISP